MQNDGRGDGFVGIEDYNAVLGNWNLGVDHAFHNDKLVSYVRLGSTRLPEKGMTGDGPALCEVGHQGLFHDEEFGSQGGLVHNRGRTFHPRYGRFMQRDPAEYIEGANLYQYVSSNPIVGLDPAGLYSWGMYWKDFSDGFTGALGSLLVDDATAPKELVDETLDHYNEAINKQYYCGNDSASDEEYEAAVKAAGDWWYGRGAVRGGFAGLRQDLLDYDTFKVRASVHGQWTMDEGYGYGGGFGLVGELPGKTSVTITPAGGSASWTQDGGLNSPNRWGASVSQGNGRITGKQSPSGISNPTIGFSFGRLRVGLIVDVQKLRENVQDAWANRKVLYDLITEYD